MYDKEYCRTSLNNIRRYVKLSRFADEFGISRTTLSMFLKSNVYDYQLSTERVNRFLLFVVDRLHNLT